MEKSSPAAVVHATAFKRSRKDALEVKFKAEASTDRFSNFLQDLGRSEMGGGPSMLMRGWGREGRFRDVRTPGDKAGKTAVRKESDVLSAEMVLLTMTSFITCCKNGLEQRVWCNGGQEGGRSIPNPGLPLQKGSVQEPGNWYFRVFLRLYCTSASLSLPLPPSASYCQLPKAQGSRSQKP